jgi:hypothetical protein
MPESSQGQRRARSRAGQRARFLVLIGASHIQFPAEVHAHHRPGPSTNPTAFGGKGSGPRSATLRTPSALLYPWRTAHDPLQGCAEGALRFVAQGRSNGGNGIAGILQAIPGQQHSPTSQVFHPNRCFIGASLHAPGLALHAHLRQHLGVAAERTGARARCRKELFSSKAPRSRREQAACRPRMQPSEAQERDLGAGPFLQSGCPAAPFEPS